MRSLISPAVIGLCLLSGCHVGTFSRLDGEGPISIPPPDHVPTREIGGGRDAAIMTSPRGFRLVGPDMNRKIAFDGNLDGAQVVDQRLYRRDGNQVLGHRLRKRSLGSPKVVAEVEGLREFRVSPRGDQIALVGRGEVLVADLGGEPRLLCQADALAVGWDRINDAVWVAARSPLAVIDRIAVTGEVTLRIPLPLELESPSLRIVVSRHGGSIVVYADDRPLESALLIQPGDGVVIPLGRPGANGTGLRKAVSTHHPDADPPLLVPFGVPVEERLTLGGAPGRVFGRVVPYTDDRFLIIDDQVSDAGPSISVLQGSVRVDHDPKARLMPQWTRIDCPDKWPRRVQGIAWDFETVTLVSGKYAMHVSQKGCSPNNPTWAHGLVRRGFNWVLNGTLAALEAAIYLPTNAALSVFGPPIAVIGFLLEPSPEWAGAAVAPLWFPFARTFDLWPDL